MNSEIAVHKAGQKVTLPSNGEIMNQAHFN